METIASSEESNSQPSSSGASSSQTSNSGASSRSRRGKLSRRGRKVMLTIHIATSIGWLGVSVTLLALSLAGLLAGDVLIQQGSYVVLGMIATVVIPPVCVAALLTGILQALGTPWGLFEHQWVVKSLGVTSVLTVGALAGLGPVLRAMANVARETPPSSGIVEAAGGLAIASVVIPAVMTIGLCAVTTLNVFKPAGRFRTRS